MVLCDSYSAHPKSDQSNFHICNESFPQRGSIPLSPNRLARAVTFFGDELRTLTLLRIQIYFTYSRACVSVRLYVVRLTKFRRSLGGKHGELNVSYLRNHRGMLLHLN